MKPLQDSLCIRGKQLVRRATAEGPEVDNYIAMTNYNAEDGTRESVRDQATIVGMYAKRTSTF